MAKKKAKSTGSKKSSAKPKAKKAAPKSKAAKSAGAKKKTVKAAKKPSPGKAAAPKKASLDLAKMFSPLDDRIVVEELGASTRTPGGLYIPDTASEGDRPRQGRVLAVGRGHREKKGRLRPLDVQVGDTVLFEKYAGSGISVGDTEFTVLRESNVLGIVSSR